MESKPTFEAVIVQQLEAPIELVYRTWAEREHLPQWLSPSDDVTLEVLQFDYREGGDYHYRYTWGDDRQFDVRGRFLQIVPEQALVFSWEPQEPDEDAGKETMVAVFFRRRGPLSTEIEVRHTLFPDEAMRRRHEEGWIGSIGRLARRIPRLQPDQPPNPD
jgi:uncharacterized protein YndB with AHSA1/START domain